MVRAPLFLNVNEAENTVIVCLLGVSPAGGHFVSTRKYVDVLWGIRLARRPGPLEPRPPAPTRPGHMSPTTHPVVGTNGPRILGPVVPYGSQGPRNQGQGVHYAPDGIRTRDLSTVDLDSTNALTTRPRELMCQWWSPVDWAGRAGESGVLCGPGGMGR